MENIFYISDMHFFHKKVINMSNRPFSSIEEMNKRIIKNWNDKVTSYDTVYILGDIAYRAKLNEVINILHNLNGKKHLIIGNHDRNFLNYEEFKNNFETIQDYLVIDDNGRKVVLFHYPIEEWDGYFRDSYHLFGHVHNNDKDLKKLNNRFNVSVEKIGYEPCTLDEIIELNK